MHSKKRLVLSVVFIMVGMLTMFVNNSIINILLPTLIRELNVSLSTAQWLSNGFIMVCGILIPVSAYLVKRFSYKRIFITAQVVFIIGSAICGISKSFTPLLIGRLVQSVGSGLAIPLVLNILVSIFPVEKRGSVMGIYSLGIVLAPALGPSIGGVVIQYHSWNVLFWGMTIVATVIFVGTLFFLEIENKTEKCRFDVGGFILSALGCGAFLYGVSQRQLSIVLPALAILIVFWFYERRRKGDALLNLGVLRNVQFSYALVINVIFTINMYAGMLLIPQYIQTVRGFTPIVSALIILPGSLVTGLLGLYAGRIYDKRGIKVLSIVGSVLITLISFLFARMDMETSKLTILVLYSIRSIGCAAAISPLAAAGLSTLKAQDIPHGNAVTNTVKQIAGSIGSSASIAILTTSSISYASANDVSPIAAVLHGNNQAFLFVTIVSFVGLILSVVYPKIKPTEELPATTERFADNAA